MGRGGADKRFRGFGRARRLTRRRLGGWWRPNEQAWQASEQHGAHDHTGSEGRDWHSLRFAQYGHLQQRRVDNARHALDQVHADAAANPSPRLIWHALRMHAAQIVDSEDWALPPYAPPTTIELATTYRVAPSTAHRAITLLANQNLITVIPGRRAHIQSAQNPE